MGRIADITRELKGTLEAVTSTSPVRSYHAHPKCNPKSFFPVADVEDISSRTKHGFSPSGKIYFW